LEDSVGGVGAACDGVACDGVAAEGGVACAPGVVGEVGFAGACAIAAGTYAAEIGVPLGISPSDAIAVSLNPALWR
jgi:hypothetical protein